MDNSELKKEMLSRSNSSIDTDCVVNVKITDNSTVDTEIVAVDYRSGIRPVICFDVEKLNSVEYI